jgi:putative ABC transport system permease protein
MMLYIKLLTESILFAVHALVANKLRTFLSLLGITIGIFSIISVFTLVDSLENKIRDSISSMGDNVVYVGKWPWTFGTDYPWWKYFQRPLPSLQEMEEIGRRSNLTEATAFHININGVTVGHGNSNIENVEIHAASHDYIKIKTLDFEDGRYFTDAESAGGRPVAVIGANIATSLFGRLNPIGKYIKIRGLKLEVIGVLKLMGESMIEQSMDNYVFIPLNYARNYVDVRDESTSPFIMVQAKPGVTNDELKDELTGVMRSLRKLKPIEEDNFALNEASLIANSFSPLFGILNIAGGIIGFFSIVVGGFGIANIMFVSVKERTNIIGIQKSLGAKNSFILFQFLSESIILCLIGGGIGLGVIFVGTLLINLVADMGIMLSLKNISIGLGISATIGLISGIVPAWVASRLDPVEAIRS